MDKQFLMYKRIENNQRKFLILRDTIVDKLLSG